ncbi:hypothetical protein KY290_028041 [Solanum tuberosum]|uniref:Uncharacterized protein n=1 Tax=Solanum tuberosum TaxID=4113 RepID=A0ABQ7UIG2_SOLTU|nr:hypothetical protein KY290_028041 [Solanum tuberosum]
MTSALRSRARTAATTLQFSRKRPPPSSQSTCGYSYLQWTDCMADNNSIIQNSQHVIKDDVPHHFA